MVAPLFALHYILYLLCRDLFQVLNEQERLRSVQDSHNQQLKACDAELQEARVAAAANAASAASAAAAAQSALRNEIAALKSEIVSLQHESEKKLDAIQRESEKMLKAKSSALVSAQQLALDLEKKMDSVSDQLSSARSELAAEIAALEQSCALSAALEQQLAAAKTEIESLSLVLKSKDDAAVVTEAKLVELEHEIGCLDHDLDMFAKMMHKGQTLSEDQLLQLRPSDEQNEKHMRIFCMIRTLNDVISASNQSRHLAAEVEKAAHLESTNRNLAAKLKDLESSVTVELERSWDMAKKMADVEEEKKNLLVAVENATAALALKDQECNVLLSQLHSVSGPPSQEVKAFDDQNTATPIESASSHHPSTSNIDTLLQTKNLEISELKIQISALKIDISRLSSAHERGRSSGEYWGQTGLPIKHDQDEAPQLSSRNAFPQSLHQRSDQPSDRVAEDASAQREKFDKIRSQNEALTSHVKSLYSEIKSLRLQHFSDADLVQKLSDMETLNVEIMKKNAECIMSKEIAEEKLEAAQLVIQHMKQCTLELDAQISALRSKSNAVNSSTENPSSCFGNDFDSSDFHQRLEESQSEARALSRILQESVASSERKEFELSLQISQLKNKLLEMEHSGQTTEALASHVFSAEKEAAEFKQLAAAKSEQVAELELSCKNLENANAALNQQVLAVTTEAHDQRKRADDESARAAEIELSSREKSSVLLAIQSQLAQFKSRIIELESKATCAEKVSVEAQAAERHSLNRVAELEQALKELHAVNDVLKEQLSTASSEKKAIQANAEQEQARAAACLENVSAELQKSRDESDSVISGLKTQLAAATKENDSLKFKVQDLQPQVESLTQHRAFAVNKAAEATAYVGQLKSRVQELEALLSSSQHSTTADLDVALADISELKVQLKTSVDSLDASKQSERDLTQQVSHLNALVEAANHRAIAAENDASSSKASASAESSLRAAFQNKLSEKEQEILRNGELLSASQAAAAELRQQLASALKESEETKAEIDELTRKIAHKDEKIIKLSTKLGARVTAAESEVAETKAGAVAEADRQLLASLSSLELEKSRNEALRVTCDRLNKELEAARGAAVDIHHALGMAPSEFEVVMHSVKELQVVNSSLQDQLVAACAENSDLKSQVRDMDARIVAAESRAAAADSEVNAANQTAAACRHRSDSLEMQEKELNDAISGYKHSILASSQELDSYKQQNESLSQRIAELDAQVISLQYDVETNIEKAVSAEKLAAQYRSRVASEIASGIEFERDKNELLRVACDRLKEELSRALKAAADAAKDNGPSQNDIEIAMMSLQLRFDSSLKELVDSKNTIAQLEERIARADLDANVSAQLAAALEHNEQLNIRIGLLEESLERCQSRASASESYAIEAKATADAAAAAEVARTVEIASLQSLLLQEKAAAFASASRVGELEESCRELETIVNGLKESMSLMQVSVTSQSSPADIQSEISELWTKLASSTQETEAARRLVDDAREQAAAEAGRSAAALALCKSECDAKISDLMHHLALSEQKTKVLQNEIEDMKLRVSSEISSSIEFEKNRNDALQSAVDRLRAELASALQAALLVGHDDDELSRAQEQHILELKSLCDEDNLVVEELRKQLADKVDECNRVMLELNQMSQGSAELEIGMVSIASKLVVAENDAAAALKRADALTSSIAEVQLAKTSVEMELESTKKMLAESLQTASAFNQRVAEQDAYLALVQGRAVAAENEVAGVKARASAHLAEFEKASSELSSTQARLAVATTELESSKRETELLQQSAAETQARCVALQSRVSEAEASCALAAATADSARAELRAAKLQYEEMAETQRQELAGVRERVAAADLSVAFLRSVSKGKDDTIKLLRSEYEAMNSKLGQALANDAAFSGLKIALHEANAQRASLVKTLSDSQNKMSEVTSECDALGIRVAQLEKERDGLVEEIHEYNQLLAQTDRKMNEYEALIEQLKNRPSSASAAAAAAAAAQQVPQAWNLSEPSKAVQQTDTYVLQSSPEKVGVANASQATHAVPASPEVDEYDDMLQVTFVSLCLKKLSSHSSVCQRSCHARVRCVIRSKSVNALA